jgi:hypothetical protein
MGKTLAEASAERAKSAVCMSDAPEFAGISRPGGLRIAAAAARNFSCVASDIY